MSTATEFEKFSAPEQKRADKLSRKDLRELIEAHRSWLDSAGEAGKQADLTGKSESADLVDARLPNGLFQKTILKGADLTLADFRAGNLVQANLAEANLLGTQLQQCNLQAADLRGSTGLLSPQLAGANLFGSVLPESVSPVRRA